VGGRAVEGGYSSDAEPDFVGIGQHRPVVRGEIAGRGPR
jgi:hypothetical protein